MAHITPPPPLAGDRVLASVESDATQSGVTTIVDVTNLTLSNVVVTNSAVAWLVAPYTFGSASGQAYVLYITKSDNTVLTSGAITSSGTSALCPITLAIGLAAGTWSIKARVARSGGAGSCGVGAGSGLGFWQRLSIVGS